MQLVTHSTKRILQLCIILAICGCNLYVNPLQAQNDSLSKEAKKGKTELEKVEKLLSFKNLFHRSDSSKLGKRYIRWHKKLTRDNPDYRFTIKKDDLKDSIGWKPDNSNALTKEIFGWYPYWDKNLYKSLNYSLLSTVAYFSYEVNPKTGDTLTTNGWLTEPSVDVITNKDKRVLLTITNFGYKENRQFLKNPSAGNLLIQRAIELIEAKGANGVCIDFEGIPKSQKKNFNSFIAQFGQELREANKDFKLYLTIPALDYNEYLDFETLTPVVDQFIIMGYDYYGKTSKVAGPVAPLHSGTLWSPINLNTSVALYLKKGVPSDQLILALPFYGQVWNTKTGDRKAKVDKYVGARTYDYIRHEMSKVPIIKARYDSISQSNYYSYILKESGSNKRQFRQIWFDSDSTMAAKMRLVNTKQLNGLGIWALGYNKKYDNYWKVIEDIFVAKPADSLQPVVIQYPDSVVVIFKDASASIGSATQGIPGAPNSSNNAEVITEKPTAFEKFWKKVTNLNEVLDGLNNFKKFLVLALLFVVFFGGAGFIIALFKPETRIFLFSSSALTLYYVAFVLLFVLAVFLNWNTPVFNQSIVLIIGFIVGAVSLYFINKIVQKKYSNLP